MKTPMNKIILTAIGVLTIIIGLEFFYYMGMNKKHSTLAIIPITPPSHPTPSSLMKKVGNLTYSDIISSASLIIETEGKIVELTMESNKIINGVEYSMSLALRGKNGKKGKYLITKTDMGNMQAFQQKDTRQLPIDFKDLKVGDMISCKLEIDLLKSYNDNLIRGTFIKLN